MVPEFTKNQIELEFQQKQLMLMGGGVENTNKPVASEDVKKMKREYTNMYFALSSVNWGRGGTLGVAWQKALTQMDAFVASKMKVTNNPMGKELLKMHTEFRRDMAKHIMTCKHANEQLPENLKKTFVERGEQKLKSAKGSLDNIYKQYMPEQTLSKSPVAKSFAIAQQRTQQMIQQILLQQQMQKVA